MSRACALLVLAVFMLLLPASARAQTTEPASKQRGYITLPDGNQLRYSVWLPKGDGPFPTLMQYEGYQAGSDPSRASNKKFVSDMLAKGYAFFGVSLAGSACSAGDWHLFDNQQGRDGAFALEWAAKQKWSNGKVALFSYSYAGIMQLWVAAQRPKHLVALAPGNVVADTYRDIAYTGGILNNVFPPEWGIALQADWALAAKQAVQEGDATCLANIGPHTKANITNSLALQQLQHPYDDAWHHQHSVVNFVDRIDVPLLSVRTYQDEETGGRQASYWDRLDPRRTWQVNSNGNHLLYQFSDAFLPTLEGFFDHFLKGEDNGFERTPHVQIWHETDPVESKPRSITTQPRLPVKVEPTPLYLGADGVLGAAPDKEGRTDYAYPVESVPVVDTASQGLQDTVPANTWTSAPYIGAGRAVFTTPPMARTVTTFGPSSADLWMSTTAPDTDVQVTITEVRPDGQEVWIQRGWLRASHRALDAAKSTELTPWHPHTQASLADMPAGEPQLLRVDVFPFGHTFRAGSSLRMYVEQPSVTGLWGYTTVKTPQTVSVLYGKAHPSRLMLGVLPEANVEPTLPGCDQLLNQACRANPVPQPSGRLDIAPAPLRVAARFDGRRRVRVRATKATPLTVELRHAGRVVARRRLTAAPATWRTVKLRRLPRGAYTLIVRAGGRVVVRRQVRVRR